MEVELEPRVKPLSFKVKAMSRESPAQKASHVLDTDLRNHWSTATNTKEWILLELDEPCLLSHIRIYNKSVLEWEISVGLRYKPETFVKVRPRCEAPRRDMMYPMNYTACRYVRISCLRGNPIAIFFVQLIGVSVAGLEPDFQPVVNYLLPHIISHKQDAYDLHLQLLQDLTNRLVMFLPQLEADLNGFSDAAESTIRFLAMLAGPLYPILDIVNESVSMLLLSHSDIEVIPEIETARVVGSTSDFEVSKNSPPLPALTVSSNFEPRRSRNALPSFSPTLSSLVFRPDAILLLLRKAYKDSHLGSVCRMASRVLLKLSHPSTIQEASSLDVTPSVSDETPKFEPSNTLHMIDYSNLFGEEFQIPDDHWDSKYLGVLDIKAVEEGVLHVLYACASQPLLCSKLAENSSDFWSALPLVQALLPALRPNVTGSDQVDDTFSQWKQPFVQHALSQIVATSTCSVYRPLLRGCAGYLASFSRSHAKAACVLIDLCSGVLVPWVSQVIAKVDLAVELVEDLLGVIQGARHAVDRARAALKYIILALSGHMDDILVKFKEVKHRILFLVVILEPFLDPAITPLKSMIAFGNVSPIFLENQEQNCAVAVNVIRTAVKKSAVLPSLESEWRRGSVAPSVLLSILEPHMQLPHNIDLRKFPVSDATESPPAPGVSPLSSDAPYEGASSKFGSHDDGDGKTDASDPMPDMDICDDASLLFAPSELRSMALANACGIPDQESHSSGSSQEKHMVEKIVSNKFQQGDGADAVEYSDLHSDYIHLMNYRECELWASEFRRLALDLHSQNDISHEGHNAAIDALLLAAECYINPFFIMSFRDRPKFMPKITSRTNENYEFAGIRRDSVKNDNNLETLALLERKRDKTVIQILVEAAELNQIYQKTVSTNEQSPFSGEANDEVINLSQRDMTSMDAITLVRQNQALLCKFLIDSLIRDRHSMREILMQSLVFFLHSATKLYCAPEHVIDIILDSAEYLNGLLSSYYCQSREGKLPLDLIKVKEVRRHWMLLQKLVIASSGGDEGSDTAINISHSIRYANLIPPSAWMQKIPTFSSSASPLVRFVGWMALSRNAQQFQKERLFPALDLAQLTNLLSIFADELAVVDDISEPKIENRTLEGSKLEQNIRLAEGHEHEVPDQQYVDLSFRSIYPDVSRFFPSMKKQFNAFGETILAAVALQLKSIASSTVPDLLCWFSDVCTWPFLQKDDQVPSKSAFLRKGFLAKNAKAIILYTLEAIVIEHMEAMVPEIPRVVHVLVSLCRTSYCDVSFLDSVLGLLKPIISYSLAKVSDAENIVVGDDSCVNFESLCFDELFSNIRHHNDKEGNEDENVYSRAPTILVLASIFPDLSFRRKCEILQSLVFWADFAAFEPTTSFYDYLSAFQAVFESCKLLLVENLRVSSIIPFEMAVYSNTRDGRLYDDSSDSDSWFLSDVYSSCPAETCDKKESMVDDSAILDQKVRILPADEVADFSKHLEALISKLNPTIEFCWKLHYQLAKRLTVTSAQCFVYSRCLFSVSEKDGNSAEVEKECVLPSNSIDHFPLHWKVSLEGLAEMVVALQENNCWEVSSMMLDCLLGVPRCFALDNVIGLICSALQKISCSAPKISWRLQTDKWLSSLFARCIHHLHESESPLFGVLQSMLCHPEPEQRFVALKHLRKLVGQDVDGGTVSQSSISYTKLPSPGVEVLANEPVTSPLVSSMWDLVAVLASTDMSSLLRTHALSLLVNFVPYAERRQLQSLLAAADNVLPALINLGPRTCGGPVRKLSFALVASACLYCPAEDISLIPENVWRSIETFGSTKNESRRGDLEVEACQALCRLKSEGDEAKGIIKEVLLSSSSKQGAPDFGSTRESLLKVLANLTSVHSYFDFFSEKNDEKLMEIVEAEVEMDLLRQEHSLQESFSDLKDLNRLPFLANNMKDDNRLKEIKDEIRSLEKTRLKEEIVARRQKKLLMRHARQKYLEEAAVHEAELLQELDRERTSEAEKEIERQRLLEVERAKTRELRHILDMEKEKQTQRELQRELEQAESGIRQSRRDFSSSTHSSRPRERYRERDNGRPTNEGSLRTSSGNLQPDINPSSPMSAMPTVVLTGSRQFSGQPPTILQSRDRQDEGGSSYEENFDGSRDSGDTGSIGDPDSVSALDGQSGGFGSGQRHGSRGSKSRQMVERRERDGRREGKWERKH